MIASELLSLELQALKKKDPCWKALRLMNEYCVSHLPVINRGSLEGIVSSSDITTKEYKNEAVERFMERTGVRVFESQHIFEVIRVFSNSNLTSIPVVNADDKFAGIIGLKGLIKHIAKLNAFHDIGGIITLEMGIRDYSLGEISRLIEYNNARVLSLYVNTNVDSTKVEVSFKLDKTDLKNIIATFERFNYTVKGSYLRGDEFDMLKDRFDSLMKYLNI